MKAYALKSIHHTLTVITENEDPSLVTQGWVGDKPCLVTVDTRAYVTVARPDITAGWPERQPNQRLMLQMVSHPERSYPNSDPGAAPTQNLGFRR
jgi:hypothetical protein